MRSSMSSRASPSQAMPDVPAKRVLGSLQERIDELAEADLPEAVAGLTDIAPDLATHLSIGGLRAATHPAYTGTANLNHIGKIWIRQGWRCMKEDVPLRTRLQHYDSGPYFQDLFRDSEKERKKSIIAWIPQGFREFTLGCAHCLQVPSYVFTDREELATALMFRKELYLKYWPEEATKEGVYIGEFKHAKKADVEALIAQGVDGGVPIMEGKDRTDG